MTVTDEKYQALGKTPVGSHGPGEQAEQGIRGLIKNSTS